MQPISYALSEEDRIVSKPATVRVYGYRYLRSELSDVVWYGTLELIRSIGMEPMMDHVLEVPTVDLAEDGRYFRHDRTH